MHYLDTEGTEKIKPCYLCGFGLLERNRFCRQCGAKQAAESAPVAAEPKAESSGMVLREVGGVSRSYDTSLISTAGIEGSSYHSVSGPLVNALIDRMSSDPPAGFCGRLARKTLSALISITIWLIIVLLSPIDAYAASKSVWAGAHCVDEPRSRGRLLAGRRRL